MSFGDRLLELVTRPRAVPAYATLAEHLRRHFEAWLAFAFDPRIGPSNGKAVVSRADGRGRPGQGVLVSALDTCRLQALSAIDHVSRTLRWFGNRVLP